jgi:hypothetical protein
MAFALMDGVCQTLQNCQQSATPRELAQRDSLLLRTFGSAVLAPRKQKRIDQLAKSLAHAIEQKWLTNASQSEWRRIERVSEARSSLANSSLQNDSAETAKAAPASPTSPAEGWRRSFGRHASTQFAFEVVSRVCRQSPNRDVDQLPVLSSTDPGRFITLASQALSAISARVDETPKLGERLSEEDEFIIEKLAASSHCVLTKLIDEIEQVTVESAFEPARAGYRIAVECVAVVEGFLGQSTAAVAIDSTSSMQSDSQQVLEKADVDLLQCGFDRRTLIFMPSTNGTNDAIDALIKARPTAAMVSANVDEAVVYCEASGISPSSLARGFERVYPGIAEAASRLFTRIDIEWSKWTL